MATKIFVNLPVKNLDRTMAFFTQVGFSFNPQFTDEKAACMIVSDDIFIMLLTEPFFKTFTKKEMVDATKSTEVILCLSADSRDAVDAMVQRAVGAGGTTPNAPQDHGFMYGHGFQDPDGHLWEVAWMAPEAVSQADTAATATA